MLWELFRYTLDTLGYLPRGYVETAGGVQETVLNTY